jgi:hypothetical protein
MCDDDNKCTVDTCTANKTCTHSKIKGCCFHNGNCLTTQVCVSGTCL